MFKKDKLNSERKKKPKSHFHCLNNKNKKEKPDKLKNCKESKTSVEKPFRQECSKRKEKDKKEDLSKNKATV